MADEASVGFWKATTLLLAASRLRAKGRRRRQRQLFSNRSGKEAFDWGGIGTVLGILFMALLHVLAAFALITAVRSGQRLEAERQGQIVVRNAFFARALHVEQPHDYPADVARDMLEEAYSKEAAEIARQYGGRPADIERKLRAEVAASGSRNLISHADAEPGLEALGRSGRPAAMLGSLLLLWWFAMLICQGEGLELDLQRRRHPMWEWLFSHPIGAGAVFFAEMLSPIVANPAYWSAPLFVGIVYGTTYDLLMGVAATVLIGVPVTVALACLGKALEIGAILRLPPRSRGAMVGILSWFGYAAMIAMFVGLTVIPKIVEAAGDEIAVAAQAPWPFLGLFLGLDAAGDFSFMRGLAFCWAVSAVAIAGAVVFSSRSIRNGLSGQFAADTLPSRPKRQVRLGQQPLYRKEYLWFVRDRSAIVQTLLIPISVAAFQLFNLRGILEHAQDSWNLLCGAAILFGTYFLWVLGPKSLASEGAALWIALTWPQGLESLLKAKAWLWSMISSGLVLVVLLAGCWMFPQDIWKIALVAAGWFVFARSMAQKSVTLVTIVSESGEAQKIPTGRRWAASLGMLTFAIGICTQQWHLAVVGIVYSWMTAAAMWENLRARLPYLYDPWSEKLPEPPTLMHAMVSVSLLIECAAILTALLMVFGGKDNLAIAQGIGYAVCAVAVSIGVAAFLAKRGVSPAQIWCWRDSKPDPAESELWTRRYIAADRQDVGWLFAGIGGGVLLALFASLYLALLKQFPPIADMIRVSEQQMRSIPNMGSVYALLAIAFAPLAEEFLFRGLVFRTLDRQWGGWMAVLGASAFFAIYHPPMAWLPVGLVGIANCLIFKKSGRLAPAVLLHMTYNALVVLAQ